MDQLRLLPPPWADKKPFLDTDLPVHRVNGVEAFLARDVCRVLGLSTTHGARGCPADQRVSIRLETLDGGPQDHVGVTIPGAFVMATHCRSELTASLRAHVDKVIVRGMTEAAKPPVHAELAALRQEVATLTAMVRAIPTAGPQTEVVARAVAVALETWEAGKYKRRSDAIKAGHARVGWVPKTGKPATPKRPALTESDVLAALRAELGPVGADNLARRHGWGRQPVREMLLGLEKAGRVEFGRHGPKGQGWRVRTEVV